MRRRHRNTMPIARRLRRIRHRAAHRTVVAGMNRVADDDDWCDGGRKARVLRAFFWSEYMRAAAAGARLASFRRKPESIVNAKHGCRPSPE